MDFGAGKELGREHNSETGDFAGTPLYVAPEVFRNQERSKASDIYSLGVLLYYLVTASYPVEGSTRTEIGRRHDGRGPQRRLRDARPDLPAPFVQVVERALAEDPARRHHSAGEFEAALVEALPRPQLRRPVLIASAALAAILIAALLAYILAPTSRLPAASLPAIAPPAPASYDIDAGLYRVRDGGPERLGAGARVVQGDRLFFRVQSSAPAHIYVVNEDDRGESYLLFPLPGQAAAALTAGQPHELPGVRNGDRLYWQVTSAGGREHFLIFANPERLTTFERLFASLPAPSSDQAAASARLPPEAVGILRGVGGLAATPSGANASMGLAQQFTTPLAEGAERVSGVWVRRVTVENPAK
jgi:hypothetical protein